MPAPDSPTLRQLSNLACGTKELQPEIETIIYHICISGFRQHSGQSHGMHRVKEKLVANCHYCNGHSRVNLYPWNEKWVWIAEDLNLVRKRYEVPLLIAIYAYSWGAGWGAITLANQLKRKNIRIRFMVLCDPVYRHPLITLRWLSLLKRQYLFFGSPTITIPANVEEVYAFRQQLSRPQGHHLVCEGDQTVLHNHPVPLPYVHTEIDNAEEFHDKVLEVANTVRTIAKLPICPSAGGN